jgi:hypothetical protein
MAYNARWSPHDVHNSIKDAEERARKMWSLHACDQGFLYRMMDVAYSSGSDDYGYSTTIKIEIEAFPIIKKTKSGWVIPNRRHQGRGRDWRLVLFEGRKKFAHPSSQDALQSFIFRKRAQARIYHARAERAELAIRKADPEYGKTGRAKLTEDLYGSLSDHYG